jgi:hypothetical protein
MLLILSSSIVWAQNIEMQAKKVDEGIEIHVDNSLFTKYLTKQSQKYPYFYPVNGPTSGKSVTTESSEPYPHHHSLFFGCDKVNGGNYWQQGLERGQIVSKSLEIIESSNQKILFENKCVWQRENADSPFEDIRRIQITAPQQNIRIIDFEITLTALIPVRIDKNNHSLFSARMVPELSVEQGGTLVNAEGLRGEEGTWGKKSSWCNYFGERNGVVEGLSILTHPQNRWFPEPWFTRNYGFFSPTPMQWLENGFVTFENSESLSLKYRVIVYSNDPHKVDIQKWYTDWTQ